MKLDLRLETIVDLILHKANKADCEIYIEPAFDDPELEQGSIIVHNVETNAFGLVACDVKEYPDDPVCCFKFNGKLYNYYKAEGFERNNIVEDMREDVFIKMSLREFCDYVLDK